MVSFPFRKDHKARESSNTTCRQPVKLYGNDGLDKRHLKQATKVREIFTIMSSFFLVMTVVFLILVETGSLSNKSVLRDIWFIKLNLSEIVPTTVPDSALFNSIARSLGLHDFYQVGLWNFCEGYFSEGITACSTPRPLYWFNPVAIIRNELLNGAAFTLPSEISNDLATVKIASYWMFGLFLTGACMSFVMIFIVPLSVYSRWNAFAITIFTALNAIIITAASIIGTVLFIVMRDAFQRNTDVNIGAKAGGTMFTLMWTASGFSILTFVVQVSLTCCCASRRDVKTGRKRGNEKAYEALP